MARPPCRGAQRAAGPVSRLFDGSWTSMKLLADPTRCEPTSRRLCALVGASLSARNPLGRVGEPVLPMLSTVAPLLTVCVRVNLRRSCRPADGRPPRRGRVFRGVGSRLVAQVIYVRVCRSIRAAALPSAPFDKPPWPHVDAAGVDGLYEVE